MTVQVAVITEETEVHLLGGEEVELILHLDKAALSITSWKAGSGIVEAEVGSLTGVEEVECQEGAQEADMEVQEECVVDVVPNGDSFDAIIVMEGLKLLWWVYITNRSVNPC
jgi:hypothetical protein